MTDGPVIVLCVVDYFLPGFQGGGPIRTIANMRKQLTESADIAVFTRDRDLGSNVRYDAIQADTWTETEYGPIYYASPEEFGVKGLKKAMASLDCDLLYLNSFFGFRSTIQIYLWSRWQNRHLPILLAPRGEFSSGALALKRIKKKMFLSLVRTLGLYRDIHWHASTEAEKDDILRCFPGANVGVAEDPVEVNFDPSPVGRVSPRPSGQLRVSFISRISPMKNLDQLLRILAGTSARIDLDIFGPIEDTEYWDRCQALVSDMPKNVSVSYKGALHPEKVSSAFADYDLFAFPTHGENFGHVVFESLRAGTPVIISNRTPWQTQESGAILAIPLDETETWRQELDKFAAMTVEQKSQRRDGAREFSHHYARTSGTAARTVDLFVKAVGKPGKS
ncbi:glycosyltransferase [Abyssibius alkaniclasticus]|uniref:glycosyltransferase n=1 Tax=Abyssibius alkaniclasticus TaxID=2881234 RepID=UPI0023634BE2|nr:glycosyltransferase [Abyssibius alkaniclasticus]UPH70238.1 glycosyltransferase [Abyssibius alkaniclasticus]